MRLAVVGWATDSGVGRELIDATRNLPVTSIYLLPSPNKPTRLDLLPKTHVYQSTGQSPHAEMLGFIRQYKPDVILTWELPGDWSFPNIWASHGIRWVNVVHWDDFDPAHLEYWKRATLVSPNSWCKSNLDELGLSSTVLPVPIDTKRIVFQERKYALNFLSVYGYGGPEGRRGLFEILDAWSMMQSAPKLLVRAQVEPEIASEFDLSEKVTIEVKSVPEPADLFTGSDVAIQPSKYEGIGITMLEAQAAGLPVITTTASPMKEIAPDLLVPVGRTDKINLSGKEISCFTPSADGIRKVVGNLMGREIRELSRNARKRVETKYSWKVLKDRWLDLLAGVPAGVKR